MAGRDNIRSGFVVARHGPDLVPVDPVAVDDVQHVEVRLQLEEQEVQQDLMPLVDRDLVVALFVVAINPRIVEGHHLSRVVIEVNITI